MSGPYRRRSRWRCRRCDYLPDFRCPQPKACLRPHVPSVPSVICVPLRAYRAGASVRNYSAASIVLRADAKRTGLVGLPRRKESTMRTRLFHSIIVCGAALGASGWGCASTADLSENTTGLDQPEGGGARGGGPVPENSCRLPDAGCNPHCSPLGDGGCHDPCALDDGTCSANCSLPDGGCGWPPTK